MTSAVNGPMNGGEKLLADPDDPEYQKQKMRPADIDQDVKEMDRRKRVDLILNSSIFREELERIIETQMKEGYSPASLLALQQISELIVPGGGGGRVNGPNVLRGSIIPIADIRGVDSFAYAKGEKQMRCKLASVYRLIDIFGWSEGIYNHVTLRLNEEAEHFLINPFGLMYHEITASSLVKVDIQGNVIELGSTNFGINVAGFNLHSAVHAARPDIKAIIHVHMPPVMAVSACPQGLIPLCHEAVLIGGVSLHDYLGIVVDPEERRVIARDLGPVNKVMILRNHGMICCGETLEEALYITGLAIQACETQVKAMTMGLDSMIPISEELAKEVKSQHEKDNVGELEFEAYMRMLDNSGYRTGYAYKRPLQRTDARARGDVEYPPSATSGAYVLDDDELLRISPLKRLLEGRKAQDKTRWLNSPNTFPKSEESGNQKVNKEFSSEQVSAASKGIIQREYQQSAAVYNKTISFTKNPFDNITDEELVEYKRIVEKKQRGESIEDRQEELLSKVECAQFELASRSPVHSPTSEEDGDATLNGNHSKSLLSAESGDNVSAVSRSSKESSPTKEGAGDTLKKEKKKKKGLRTPSFLKKKKENKE